MTDSVTEYRRLIALTEVARQLNKTPQTVKNLVRRGELEAVDLSVGSRPDYGIYADSLDAFLDRRKVRMIQGREVLAK
jgi:IS30 family transposase